MKLAICIATRGLVHSRTLESVFRNLAGINIDYRIFFTHDLPIPDSQNNLVERALEWGAEYLWFVEEDMLIPDDALMGMYAMKKEIVAIDYPVGEKRCSCIAKKAGEILWCGLGCTLIKKEVFEKIDSPWFEADKTVKIISEDPFEYVIDKNIPYKYGGHDILFGIKVREKGVEINQLEGVTAGHIKPVKEADMSSNNGTHKFEVWDIIEKFQNYN